MLSFCMLWLRPNVIVAFDTKTKKIANPFSELSLLKKVLSQHSQERWSKWKKIGTKNSLSILTWLSWQRGRFLSRVPWFESNNAYAVTAGLTQGIDKQICNLFYSWNCLYFSYFINTTYPDPILFWTSFALKNFPIGVTSFPPMTSSLTWVISA